MKPLLEHCSAWMPKYVVAGILALMTLMVIACIGGAGSSDSEITELTTANATLESDLARADEAKEAALAEVDSLTTSIMALESELTAAKTTNDAVAADLARTSAEKDQALAQVDTLRIAKANLEANLTSINEEQGQSLTELETLKSANAALESDLATANEAKEAAQIELETVEAANATLEADLAVANTTNKTLTAQTADLANSIAELESAAGRIEDLQAEISRLEDIREPLIPSTQRTQFVCTGSMEPAITCLDEATHLHNFQPEDIVVGAVISFRPKEECELKDHSGVVVHRVEDIKVEDGEHFYWTKGDNNKAPDNCWIPQGNVVSYITELHKDARPEKADLRNLVNKSQELLAGAQERYEDASQTYKDYCHRWTQAPGECLLREGFEFEWGSYLFDKLEWATQALEYATEYADCYAESARTAFFFEGKYTYFPCAVRVIPLPPLPPLQSIT